MATHGNQEVADRELIEAVTQSEHPVASTAEVAAVVEISRTAAGKRLLQLEEQGEVKKKDIGQAYVWYVPDR